jgi:glutamate synthase domain-containing protein 3
MKSYLEKFPVIIIGGRAGNFLGEYMAGGVIIVLGLNLTGNNPNGINKGKVLKSFYFDKLFSNSNNSIVGDYTGTGMHGGVIYLKKDVEDYKLGREVRKMVIDEKDVKFIDLYLKNFCSYFNLDYENIILKTFKDFIKLTPYSHRPYGKLYAY